MLRVVLNRLGFAKQLLLALIVLVALVCIAEVLLRVSDFSASRSGPVMDTSGLIAKSSSTHHKLKPLKQAFVQNPDSNESVEVATNSFGLRGSEPQVPKPANVFRIICLGDETVLAHETIEESTFCRRLEHTLTHRAGLEIEVINAGVPGYCPLLYYLQLKRDLMVLEPDLLLVHFDMTDVADEYRFRRHTVFDNRSIPLLCSHPKYDQLEKEKQKLTNCFLTVRWGANQIDRFCKDDRQLKQDLGIENPKAKYAWLEGNSCDWNIHIQQSLSSLRHLNDLVGRQRLQMVLTSSPKPWQVSETASSGARERQQNAVVEGAHYQGELPFQVLEDFATRNRIVFCNAAAPFRADPDPDRLFLQNSAGLSPLGHELLAHLLADCLTRNVAQLRVYSESESLPIQSATRPRLDRRN